MRKRRESVPYVILCRRDSCKVGFSDDMCVVEYIHADQDVSYVLAGASWRSSSRAQVQFAWQDQLEYKDEMSLI
jgi:hypothetical protein